MIREIKSWFRKVFNIDPSEGHSKCLSKSEIRSEIKEREDHILHILSMYKRGSSDVGKSCYVISSFKDGLNYRDSSSDICVKVTILGKYSADAESAKHYSYPDIDSATHSREASMTKTGTVCREELTGRIYDFDSWTIFYKNEPHSWVSLLDYEERVYYSSCMSRNVDTMDELYEKFKVFLSKEDLRDIRLKELGI